VETEGRLLSRRVWVARAGSVVACAWALALHGARAQTERRRRIWVLLLGEPSLWSDVREDLLMALADRGWQVGKNLEVTWRYARDSTELNRLARECAESGADAVITRGTPATRVLQQATRTVPILTGVGDPVGSGFARSLSASGTNITGLSWATVESAAKQLQLLREVVPDLRRVVMLLGPNVGLALKEMKEPMERAVRASALDFSLHLVKSASELAAALRSPSSGATSAAYTPGLPDVEPQKVAQVLRDLRWPSMFDHRTYVDAGGLMSYHLDWTDQAQRTATQIDKILRGVPPDQIPFEQPTRTQLVINMATAKSLGLAVPASVRLMADELVS
jgi:putative tryptophan/tyrosine transport system substrate-binding protein